jgi:hypothetical protein
MIVALGVLACCILTGCIARDYTPPPPDPEDIATTGAGNAT